MTDKIQKIYIAGSVTDNPNYKTDFREAEEYLKHKYPEAEIYNPVALCEAEGITDWELCMSHTHRSLMKADCIALIGGWTQSKGARLELAYALAVEMEIINLELERIDNTIHNVIEILNDVRNVLGGGK